MGGKTLDEISAIVQKINSQLEEKSAYDQAKSSIDGELNKVAGEVRQLDQEVLEAEQSYHDLNMQLSTADSKLQRAHHETKCLRKEERLSPEYATLSDQYTQTIKRLDDQCNQLRKDKKQVEATHGENLKQKKAFVQLQKLMDVKLRVAKQEMQNIADGRYGGMATRTVMDSSTAGVDRLVIE